MNNQDCPQTITIPPHQNTQCDDPDVGSGCLELTDVARVLINWHAAKPSSPLMNTRHLCRILKAYPESLARTLSLMKWNGVIELVDGEHIRIADSDALHRVAGYIVSTDMAVPA